MCGVRCILRTGVVKVPRHTQVRCHATHKFRVPLLNARTHSPASIRLMMALTPKRLFLSFSLSSFLSLFSAFFLALTIGSINIFYKTGSSLVKFRRKPFQSTQKTTEDVDNGHSKECRSFDVDLHFQDSVLGHDTQANGCAGAIAPEHAAAKRGHHRFFFLVREKGGFVRTLRTPLGYVPGLRYFQRVFSRCFFFIS